MYLYATFINLTYTHSLQEIIYKYIHTQTHAHGIVWQKLTLSKGNMRMRVMT